MATRVVNIDRDTPLLLSPDLRDWVPGDHLAHFIIDAVEALDLRQVKVNARGTGDAQYPPSMLLGLLVYSYATPLQDGLSIPEEIVRRQKRKAALEEARARIEARAHARYAGQLAEHEKKMAARLEREERGNKSTGPVPRPPRCEPDAKEQTNFTDPESRIMKSGNGYVQAYNAQAAVEVDSRLIVGERVSQAPNDKEQLAPTFAAIAPQVGPVAVVLTDSGFHSEEAVGQIELKADGTATGTTVYAPLDKKDHQRTVADLEQRPEPEGPPPNASHAETMRHRLKTTAGRQLYKLRQQTVEPVIGIIKSAMGFHQFRLRGVNKVSTEWTLVCLAYNLRRLHVLGAGKILAATG